MFKNWSFQKMSITIKMPLNWYSSMKKKFRKIRIIFDIENWLWKSEIRIFQSPPAKRTLICQKHFFMEKCYFSLNLMRKLLKKSWMVSTTHWCNRIDQILTYDRQMLSNWFLVIWLLPLIICKQSMYKMHTYLVILKYNLRTQLFSTLYLSR